MTLWIILIGMTVLASLIAAWPILRTHQAAGSSRGEIRVYADQMVEVARDQDRGLIGAAEAAAARIEIGRRILKADRTGAELAEPPARRSFGLALLVVVVVAGLSLALYARLGSPAMPDMPLAERKELPPERMTPEELIARLDDALAKNPNDVKGWDVAAPVYMRVGRIEDAIAAYRKAIALGGVDARRQAGLGEALVLAANGLVTSEARTLFEAVRRLDPNMPIPKMYLALALSQDGKLDEAAIAWQDIIDHGRGYEPWVRVARRELAAIEAKRSGVDPEAQSQAPAIETRPPAPPVISANEPDRAMIETMVSGLAARLEKDGGTVEDWGKLIKSYRVLGRDADAQAAYAKARTAFAAKPDDLAALNGIVADLGLAPTK